MKNKRYTNAGYTDRRAYLKELSKDYPGVNINAIAEKLGAAQDFTGLIAYLDSHHQPSREKELDFSKLTFEGTEEEAANDEVFANIEEITNQKESYLS